MGVVDMNNNVLPIVYTIKGCDACVKLLTKWDSEGIEYEERRADLSQEMMDEARKHGDVVPIVVYPNGSTEEGFEGGIGCYIG
jgi:glutaredoxin